ncbi:MAG: type V CRISPR-associated protein Cas12a/Cpf1 [Synergistaceae bacterium]
MAKSLLDFSGKYLLSKTLRFELKPIGKTEDYISKRNLISEDEARRENYKKVKKIIDRYHKKFISNVLNAIPETGANLDWTELEKAIKNKTDDKYRENLEKEQKKKREEIIECFSGKSGAKTKTLSEEEKNKEKEKQEFFKQIFSEKLFSEILVSEKNLLTEEEVEQLKTFNKFSTYFTGFHENRKNMYSSEEKSTSVAYRIVNENFPKFLTNIEIYNKIKEIAPEIITETENELKDILNGTKLDEIFNIKAFNKALSQEGIDYYNLILSGRTEKAGERKIQGINEKANLFRQQHKDNMPKGTSFKMLLLFKQILSDRETLSFIPEKFLDDKEVLDTINALGDDFSKTNLYSEIRNLLSNIDEYDTTKIYVENKNREKLSPELLGNWEALKNAQIAYKENEIGSPEKSTNLKKIEKYLKQKTYSLKEINEAISFYMGEEKDYTKQYIDNLLSDISAIEKYQNKFNELKDKETNLLENENEIEIVKNYLDAIEKIFFKIKMLQNGVEIEIDVDFYSQYDKLFEQLKQIIFVYDKVRNYVTQKPYSEEKFKLTFKCPTLANGWDKNKEKDNLSILLLKDGNYYLGIMNKDKKLSEKELIGDESVNQYRKITYKFLPGPNKMLPKVFLSKKGIETFNPSKEILENYKNGMHKGGDTFDLEFCHKLIDFFKDSISKHEDWKNFGFEFSKTETYENISKFYKEVAEQGYKITFDNISEQRINKFVEDGKLYLFQIWNKDFANGATGKKNLHTLYWESLFSEENLKDVIYKLNGEAELFFRKKSIENPIRHEIGSKKVNKRDSDGNAIPDEIYKEIYLHANGKKAINEINTTAREYIEKGNVRITEVKHELIKDKRYTENKYLFHVPITINFKLPDKVIVNNEINKFLKDNKDINIIGIDRGERNLIYVTLINRKGELLEQKDYNNINKTDYHAKLDTKERSRDEARKNWKTIEKIKELKEGYLSQVVHEIVKMAIEYNAIIVMEDLNFGFKRGRFHVEKQVYQKFEKMLIDKLNYLVFKEKATTEPCGILKGLQLTEKFDSFKNIGKQNGILFYIPASYTSKIDPVTGFANLFNLSKTTTQEKQKEFMSKIDSIKYVKEEDKFVFEVDYDKFDTYQTSYKKKWSIYTNGKRIVGHKENGKWQQQDTMPTEEMKKVLFSLNVPYEKGEELKDYIENREKEFAAKLYYIFKNTLQLRNSNAQTGEDYIISPVKDKKGKFFDSRTAGSLLPKDADANGAYHIALKGLCVLDKIDENLDENGEISYKEMTISTPDWFEFAQTRDIK